MSYEVDLWGRLRATAQAARADLLATEAARETVRITLAADVVKGYFALRSLDAQVAATRRALRAARRRRSGCSRSASKAA